MGRPSERMPAGQLQEGVPRAGNNSPGEPPTSDGACGVDEPRHPECRAPLDGTESKKLRMSNFLTSVWCLLPDTPGTAS